MAASPLNDYALIANDASAALIGSSGSIDWCCMPWVDSPSVFGALLDENRGGRFAIYPIGEFRAEQRFLQRSLVLETLFETPTGRAVLTDWMPMEEELSELPLLRRKVEVLSGRVDWTLLCAPRFGYGADLPEMEIAAPDTWFFRGSLPDQLASLRIQLPRPLSPIREQSAGVFLRDSHSSSSRQLHVQFSLEAGEAAQFAWGWGRRTRPLPWTSSKTSEASWHHWAHRCPPEGCTLRGPWHDTIVRASLPLRVLCSESVTTSVSLNPTRNWDYRYLWLRDSHFAMHALRALGHVDEARRLFSKIAQIVRRDRASGLQPVYRVDGGRILPESELNFLSGYRGSRPVRIGNLSSQLFQLDVYGHVMLAAEEYQNHLGQLPPDLWPALAEIADLVAQAWRRPDHGPWESRLKSEHFTVSKVLSWAAIDRACKIGQALGKRVPQRWHDERQILHRTICAQGYDAEAGTFVRSFGDRELDSSTLILPLVGFLPFSDPRIQSTLITIQSELSEGTLLLRDRATAGPFLLPSFRFISCLAQSGRVDEASDRLAELCSYASPLGLFAEQVDATTGEMTGNLPCLSVHVALIQAGWDVATARSRQRGERRGEAGTFPAAS